jgi:hypothetical protein
VTLERGSRRESRSRPVTCCAAHRSRPTLFVAVVALSAVAFVGQALAAAASADATAVAVDAVATLR